MADKQWQQVARLMSELLKDLLSSIPISDKTALVRDLIAELTSVQPVVTDGDMCREFARLKLLKDRLTAGADRARAEQLELGQRIVAAFTEEGKSSQKGDYGTVFLSNTVWASAPDLPDGSGKDYERLQTALIKAGYGDLVKPTVNVQQLSSLVREFPTDENGNVILPPALVGAIKISNNPEVRIRGAK